MRTDPSPVVLVFADVDGAGALWGRDPATMRRALEVHDEVLRSRVAAFGGEPGVACGAGVVTVWRSAATAIRFCLAVQEGLVRAPWPAALLEQPEAAVITTPAGHPSLAGLRVRMGVHVGTVRRRPGPQGEVLDGAAVRRTARIAGAGRGGQVLASRAVWRLAREATGGDVLWNDLGEQRLRGVPGRIALYDVRSSETAVRRFEPLHTPDGERTNVAVVPDAFLGRDADVAAIAELLEMGVRVVSVVGPDGVGRSRLCGELVGRALGRWTREGAGGVWRADCTGVRDLDDLLYAVAQALDVPLAAGRTPQDAVQQIARVLGRRGEVVLVLDGLESWFEDAVAVVTAWSRRVPDLRILLTAGRRVGVEGEVPYHLAPLEPASEGHPARSAAVRLLLRRIRERAQGPSTSQAEVAEALTTVGGLPLVIELLAGQAGGRALGEVAGDVAARLGAAPSDRERLRAVLDTCLTHLASWERGALARLAVFRGTFDVRAAEVVADLGEWVGAPPIEDALHRLRERGFIEEIAVAEDPAVVRYRVHPAVRRHLLGVFGAMEIAKAAERLARHVVAVAAEWADEVPGPHGAEALAALEELRPNLVAAFDTALDAADRDRASASLALDAVLVLDPLLSRRGPLRAHEARLDRAIALAEDRDVDPRRLLGALRARARIRYLRGRGDEALADLERAREVGRKAGDRPGEGVVVGALGQLHAGRGEVEVARRLLQEALQLLEGVDAPREIATVRAALGSVLADGGSLARAEAHLAAAVRGFRASDDVTSEGLALARLGAVRRRLGNLDAAASDLEAARAVHRASGDKRREADVLEHLGAVLQQRERFDEAGALLGEGLLLARGVGDRALVARIVVRLGQVRLAVGDVEAGRKRFHEALALARDAGAVGTEGVACAGLAIVRHLEGNLSRALEDYRRGTDLLARDGRPREEAGVLALAAGCRAGLGEGDMARALIRRVRERGDSLEDARLSWLADRAEVWVDLEMGLVGRDGPEIADTRARLDAVPDPEPFVWFFRRILASRIAG